MTMVKLGMIKNYRVDQLIEIQKKNKYKDWQMAEITEASVETWRRWRKQESFTRSHYKLKKIDKIIDKYK